VFVVFVFPVFWMVSTALKPDDQIFSRTPTWLPLEPTLQHFRDAMDRPFFWDTVKNSLIVVTVTVAAAMVLAFFAAVALAKYRFTGQKLFVVVAIGILMLPPAGLVIPLYVVLARYHLTNALTGVILTYMTFVLPFAVYTLRGFILGIPRDLEQAAMVDGSTRVGAFVRILLPLVAPGLVATSVCAFITSWNELQLRERALQRPVQPHRDGVAVVLLRDEPEHRLGRTYGGVDADRHPGDRLLPARPAADHVRADVRRRAGLSRLSAAVLAAVALSMPADAPGSASTGAPSFSALIPAPLATAPGRGTFPVRPTRSSPATASRPRRTRGSKSGSARSASGRRLRTPSSATSSGRSRRSPPGSTSTSGATRRSRPTPTTTGGSSSGSRGSCAHTASG
jgi:ABC-type glycerol-3-phosphate transport system permease component